MRTVTDANIRDVNRFRGREAKNNRQREPTTSYLTKPITRPTHPATAKENYHIGTIASSGKQKNDNSGVKYRLLHSLAQDMASLAQLRPHAWTQYLLVHIPRIPANDR